MANYGGTDPGRTGPYWRRQQGNTLPGERTAAELALVNAQRYRMGLPPLGGPALRGAAPAAPAPHLGQPGGVGPMPGEPGAAPAQMGQVGDRVAFSQQQPPRPFDQAASMAARNAALGNMPLPQLLGLKAMFAQATGQPPRPAMPAQRSVLPQLHKAVPVKAHVRIVPPRPGLGPQNLPSHLRGAYPA